MLPLYHECNFKTLIMTKQEKIQDAYGIHWNFYKDKVDENGWIDCRKLGHGNLIPIMEVKDIQFQKHKQRPKSLQGIAENNGWIKIESEADLPKEDLQCWLIDEEFGTDIGYFSLSTKKWFVDCEQFPTHYQPITKPNKPIY